MLSLVRVDDRLVHGQVVEGWLRVVQAGRILVVSDEAAADPLQVRLMRLAIPPEVELTVQPVAAAAEALKRGEWAQERVLLLVPGLPEARRLAEIGVDFDSLNLGGLHDAPGRVLKTPSLALGPEDEKDILFLLDRKIDVETRALPGDERVSARAYLP